MKLTVSAPGDREIVMTRVFDAPRHLVFEALTQPDLVKRWLGVRNGWTLPVCEIDLRVGGAYRYTWRKEARGAEMTARGVFREIVAPERLVCTEKFDDSWFPGEAINTTVLIEHAGQTTLSVTMLCDSSEGRDTVLKSPMESGVGESYDKMAELLATLVPAS